jgi:hypothetical protein
MGKRLNPHRRLLAAQAALLQRMRKHGNEADAGKLQEGRVRSSVAADNSKQGLRRHIKYKSRPHSKFGDEPPDRPSIPGTARLNRTVI